MSGQKITTKGLKETLIKQKYRCALSGRELTPETASADHIVPIATGGEHNNANIWIVDYEINIAKGTMSKEDFIKMCGDVCEFNKPK